MKTKSIKNVTGVAFEVNFEGKGCVNFDSQEQKYFLIKNGFIGGTKNENLVFAKKIFRYTKDEDGETKVQCKYKVSSECLRHEVFAETMPFQNPSIAGNPFVLYNAIGMQDYILRGYMVTQRSENSLKKKSALTLTDAVETGEWRDLCNMDFHSATMEKDTSEKEEGDMKGTSVYNIENVGDNIYTSQGFINVSELQFIPADISFDRLAIDNDGGRNTQCYLESLKRNMVNFEPKFDFYYMKNSYAQDEWAEQGILLNNESVDAMIKRALTLVSKVNITRRGSYLKFKDFAFIKIYLAGREEPVLVDFNELENYSFEYEPKYLLADEEKIQKNREAMAAYKKAQNSEKKNSEKKATKSQKK